MSSPALVPSGLLTSASSFITVIPALKACLLRIAPTRRLRALAYQMSCGAQDLIQLTTVGTVSGNESRSASSARIPALTSMAVAWDEIHGMQIGRAHV